MPDCELLSRCPFFNDSTYGMPEMYKERYCKGDYRWCGRYMAFKAGEIVVICAWCSKEIGRKPGLGQSGVSHGICPECKEKYFTGGKGTARAAKGT